MRRWALCAITMVLVGCEPPLVPPEGAVPLAPDRAQYLIWWRQVEACSGLRGNFDDVDFFFVPGVSAMVWGNQVVNGVWLEHGNRIILAEGHVDDEDTVRHEMLHSLLFLPGHPAEYFQARCRTLVN
jgi:hypothetical protein